MNFLIIVMERLKISKLTPDPVMIIKILCTYVYALEMKI